MSMHSILTGPGATRSLWLSSLVDRFGWRWISPTAEETGSQSLEEVGQLKRIDHSSEQCAYAYGIITIDESGCHLVVMD